MTEVTPCPGCQPRLTADHPIVFPSLMMRLDLDGDELADSSPVQIVIFGEDGATHHDGALRGDFPPL